AARAEVDRLTAKSADYQAELNLSTTQLRDKDARLSELQTRFAALSTVEAALKTRDSELAKLKAYHEGWEARLKEVEERAAREIAAAQAAAPEARLTAELNTLRATLARQENEIAKLLDRI